MYYLHLSNHGIIIINEKKTPGWALNKLDSYLLVQLSDDGYLIQDNNNYLLTWDNLYVLFEDNNYSLDIQQQLCLPKITYKTLTPNISSFGSLSDSTFKISIGWLDINGFPVNFNEYYGPIISDKNGFHILPKEQWLLWQCIIDFNRKTEAEHNYQSNLKSWGLIRAHAIAAHAKMDRFLQKTIVLTPEKLILKHEIRNNDVIEIIPEFDSSPVNWLDTFDKYKEVKDIYPISEGVYQTQVVISSQVKTVLREIKAMPGRRVSGFRARAFLENPFSLLGPDANNVIDIKKYEESLFQVSEVIDEFKHFEDKVSSNANGQEAGYFDRFEPYIQYNDDNTIEFVGISIVSGRPDGSVFSENRNFGSPEELNNFITSLNKNLTAGLSLCAWKGYDFEIDDNTRKSVEIFQHAYASWGIQILTRNGTIDGSIFDLSQYTDRIIGIGEEKPYISPYIVKLSEKNEWFPEDVVSVLLLNIEDDNSDIVPVNETVKKIIEDAIKGKMPEDYVVINEVSTMPISVKELKKALDAWRLATEKINIGEYPEPVAKGKESDRKRKQTLIIRSNIENLDYCVAAKRVLKSYSEPRIPPSMKSGMSLREHQRHGVSWLQKLFDNSPSLCRGCILADDMGLGKTIQTLCLIIDALNNDEHLPPALIVAPVSLLINWEEEINRFFCINRTDILTAYGDDLSSLRVPPSSIKDEVKIVTGNIKLLNKNWIGQAKIVLTTYETLRDYEFSFAAQKWSIMVCDEAQKIKNPNALLTRSAKKMNVRFRIACTGTPVENSLTDLWCLFDFVLPGLLGPLNIFGRKYRRPIEAKTEEEKSAIEELRKIIEPFVLRRMKKDIANDLPCKKIDKACRTLPISEVQRMFYSQALDEYHDENGYFNSYLKLLCYLRTICTDPRQYGTLSNATEDLVEYEKRAPKFKWLIDLLSKIRLESEKVIIFCEFRDIQRQLQMLIQKRFSILPDIINGDTTTSKSSTENRQRRIDRYSQVNGFNVIILSPLAAGLGLNIQAANHVVHYMRHWNPAKEDQATDRAYRIGQKKDVSVYYPTVCAEDFQTFDVCLDQLLERKRKLAEDMLNGNCPISDEEFDISKIMPKSAKNKYGKSYIGEDLLSIVNPDNFESLIALIWKKREYSVRKTPRTGDKGVDVVAIIGRQGVLIQCKTSSIENTLINREAIGDILTGFGYYKKLYPGILFQLACATNQKFNPSAHELAQSSNVMLIERKNILDLLEKYPCTLEELNHLSKCENVCF